MDSLFTVALIIELSSTHQINFMSNEYDKTVECIRWHISSLIIQVLHIMLGRKIIVGKDDWSNSHAKKLKKLYQFN